ncbi:MAG: hypothetical protein ABSE82_16685, partial [Nitrososphaerales archaeon]
TDDSVPFTGWENNLAQVLNYTNQNLPNNYAFIAFSALPLGYFTNHPVIDMTTYFGVASELDLIGTNNTRSMEILLSQGVHYMLIPSSGNSVYQYYTTLSKNFKFLSPHSIESNPQLVLISNFTDYQLYQIDS